MAPGLLVFAAFAIAFAVKVPIFPFHTWLPDAHVEAPSTGSVILAGVLLKMGAYGFIRFNRALLPEAWDLFTPLLVVLAVIGIIYGALVAMVQVDVKKLVAYSSVSHMGFVMLGLAAGTQASTQGAILQMVNHGLSTGGLFLLVGMLYQRRYTRMIDEFGGLAGVIPVFTGCFLFVTLSSIGLPGTQRLRRRVPDSRRIVERLPGCGRVRRVRNHPRCGLHAVDGAEGILGPARQQRPTRACRISRSASSS